MHPTEPRLEDRMDVSERDASRFLRKLLLLVAGALALLGGFNYLVDPYRFYDSPLDLPRNPVVRLIKLDLLRAADPPPEALILGSSRVRTLHPVNAERLFGLRTFHLGGPKSAPQNWLSLTRYAVEELGYPIRLVIVGVDPSSFVDLTNYLHHPSNVPELRRHLRHPRLSRIRSLVHLWSPQQTLASVSVAERAIRGLPAPGVSPRAFRPDGYFERAMAGDPEEITGKAVNLHRMLSSVEREHLDDFATFVDFATERGIEVVAFVTPEAPWMTRLLEGTHYPVTVASTRAILRDAAAKGVIDCDVGMLGLRDEDFVDPHHTTPQAGVRVLRLLRVCASEKGYD